MILTISGEGEGRGNIEAFVFFVFAQDKDLLQNVTKLCSPQLACHTRCTLVTTGFWRRRGNSAGSGQLSHQLNSRSWRGLSRYYFNTLLLSGTTLPTFRVFVFYFPHSALILLILKRRLKVVSSGNSLPGHIHTRGDCHEDRPHWSSGTGEGNLKYIWWYVFYGSIHIADKVF